MQMNEIQLIQSDEYRTIIYPFFTENDAPKGSILILHGVAEHHSRYEHFADFLNKNGYDVFLYDHRGHGTDKKYEEIGVLPVNGYEKLVSDALAVLDFIRRNSRSSNLILFAHSMGSLVARVMVQFDDHINKLVLSGTSHQNRLVLRAGLLLASYIKKKNGSETQSHFLHNCIFSSNTYKKVNKFTAYDWLSRNTTIVDAYIHDPFCGFIGSTGLYHALLKLALNASSPSKIAHTRRDLPIFIISGMSDPVGNFGHDVSRYFSLLQKLGFSKLDCSLYHECRHELLNETNNEEIYKDILEWISADDTSSENTGNTSPAADASTAKTAD